MMSSQFRNSVCPRKFEEDWAKMVAVCVDTKPDDAIP